MEISVNKLQQKNSQSVANSFTPTRIKTGTLKFEDNRPEAIQMRKMQEIADNSVRKNPFQLLVNQFGTSERRTQPAVPVFQRMSGDDSDVDIHSDLGEDKKSETTALVRSYKSGRLPKKMSKQVERIKELRAELRKKSSPEARPRVINAVHLQRILANLNLKYSPQNTTAIGIGIGSQQNEIVTKMGGANANYLARVLKAKLAVVKAKSAKGSNKHHAEKELTGVAGKKEGEMYRRIIIDKPRCDVCKLDSLITNSAKAIRDGSKN